MKDESIMQGRRYKLPYPADGEPKSLKVLEMERHRNGVAGDGFYAIRFQYGDDKLLGIVTDSSFLAEDDPCYGVHVYVVEPENLSYTLRGHDYFGDALVSVVRAWYRENGWTDETKRLRKGRI